jgi:tetratricopeptide (TPR) repeat protein
MQETATGAQTPTGPASERTTLAALQSALERARLEYAARRYESAGAILKDLWLALPDVAKMPETLPEPLPDRVLLAASVACLTARLRRQTQPSVAKELFAQSAALFRQFEKDIEQQKLPTRLYTDYGIALYRTEDIEQAIRVLELACASGAAPPETFGYLGLAYQSKKAWEAAENALRKGLQLQPDDPVLTRHLAVVLQQRGKLDEAASAFADAALAHQRIDRLDDAAELAAAALKLDPGLPDAIVLAVEIERARQNPQGSMAIVEQVLKDNPRHAWARGLKALLLSEQGHFQEALDEFSATDADVPELAWVFVERARTLLQMDSSREKEARDLLDRAAKLDPNQPGAPLLLGQIELEKGNYEEAIQSLRRAVDLDPQTPFIICELGRAHLAAGQIQDAHACFDRALAADQTLVPALTGKAQAYLVEDRSDEALLMIRRARQFAPDNSELLLFLVETLLLQKRPEVALAEIDRELERRPEDGSLHSAKGDILYDQKRYREALEAFENAARLVPDNPDLCSRLAETARLAGDYEMAGDAYARGLKLQPESAYAMALNASYLGEIAAYEEAWQLTRAAIDREKKEPWIWGVHAWTLQHIKSECLEEARQAYQRALDLKPENQQSWFRKGLANTLCELGRKEEADVMFRAIVDDQKYSPEPEVLGLLGWCQYRLRRYDEAIRLLQLALSSDSDPVAVQFDLALTVFAASGTDIGYRSAIASAGMSPKLRQRGLYYIALFDLVEAIREKRTNANHQEVVKKLTSCLAESGVDLKRVYWLESSGA